MGIGLTNVGPVPINARGAEEYLLGRRLTGKEIHEAAERAARDARPTPDRRGSEAYKRDLVRVLTVRALGLARDRAGGKWATGAEEPIRNHRSGGGAAS